MEMESPTIQWEATKNFYSVHLVRQNPSSSLNLSCSNLRRGCSLTIIRTPGGKMEQSRSAPLKHIEKSERTITDDKGQECKVYKKKRKHLHESEKQLPESIIISSETIERVERTIVDKKDQMCKVYVKNKKKRKEIKKPELELPESTTQSKQIKISKRKKENRDQLDDTFTVNGLTAGLMLGADQASEKTFYAHGVNDPLEDDHVIRSLKVEEDKSLHLVPIGKERRKLLILDVNGLLADIVFPPPKDQKAKVYIKGRAVFMRPHCNRFLRFCFDNFVVGIWSSRYNKVLESVVDYLVGEMKHKLLFCWDMTQCTDSRFKTLENRYKPLVFKDLRKVWFPAPDLGWNQGEYTEANTLLIDDNPYKSLLNPRHNGIFPYSYKFYDDTDNSLGKGGDLRAYLKCFATAENVQRFVEKNPFGQKPLDDTNSNWNFYLQAMRSVSATLSSE